MFMGMCDALPAHMHAVVTTGNAGYDRLDHRLVPTPVKVIQETDFCGPFVMAGLGVITRCLTDAS